MENLTGSSDPVSMQQNYYENLGDVDWDSYNLEEHDLLKRIIGFAMYGPPAELNEGDNSTGFNEKQNKNIDLIYELIKANHFYHDPNVIVMRVIFIVCQALKKKKKAADFAVWQTPVFVVKKCSPRKENGDFEKCCNIFIDDSGRVYQGWNAYLEENKLPKCKMFCPKNGKYSGEIVKNRNAKEKVDPEEIPPKVLLEILESPECGIGHQILDGVDTTGTVVSVGSTAVMVAAIIPGIAVAPAALAVAAGGGIAVGVYAIGRSIATLVDRGKHDQSIGLKNSESRACWLNAGVGALSVGTSAAAGLLTKFASNGTKIGQSVRVAYNSLNIITLVGSTGCMINCGYNIYEKLQNNEKISALEIFQFTTSILFLYKSTVGFKSASTIISETQTTTLQNYEKTLRSNRHRKLFRKAQLESRRINGQQAGNAEIISGIRKINDPDNFFAGLARINKDLNKNGARYTISSEGKVVLNSAHVIDPMEFSSISKSDRTFVLSGLPDLQPTLTQENFKITKTYINNWFVNFIKSNTVELGPLAMRIVNDIVKTGFDMDTMSFLLSKYSEELISHLFKLLVNLLKSVEDQVVEYFKELFPYVSFAIGILQFVMKEITEIARSFEISLLDFIKTCFNHDGSVNEKILKDLLDDLQKWITTKRTSLTTRSVDPFVQGRKVIQSCKICNGQYFKTENV